MRKDEVLQSLHDSPAHNMQFEVWEADCKFFDDLKADSEDELRRLCSEAYQVASLYSVFQGVIFTAVAQASRLSCNLWWCPVSISVAVSLATFLAIIDRLHSIGEVREDIFEINGNIIALTEHLDKVEMVGASLDLEKAQPEQKHRRDERAGCHAIGSLHGICALTFLTAFSFVIATFSSEALCRHCKPC